MGGLAGGVESMSMYNMTSGMDMDKFSKKLATNEMAAACLTPMGITSENVAEKWQIPRSKQDQMAVDSHNKALAAQKAGFFDEEIEPVTTTVKDMGGTEKEIVVTADEGPRAGTTVQGLSKLKAVFKQDGTTHAGNASQISDGAALVLLARRDVAKKLSLPILARMRSYAVVGVDPNLMGIGPAFAIPAALQKTNLSLKDVDIFEINEAFASQATMSVEHLQIPMEKVNPKGGAIALGHPLGCTGSRQIATLLPELKRTNARSASCRCASERAWAPLASSRVNSEVVRRRRCRESRSPTGVGHLKVSVRSSVASSSPQMLAESSRQLFDFDGVEPSRQCLDICASLQASRVQSWSFIFL